MFAFVPTAQNKANHILYQCYLNAGSNIKAILSKCVHFIQVATPWLSVVFAFLPTGQIQAKYMFFHAVIT